VLYKSGADRLAQISVSSIYILEVNMAQQNKLSRRRFLMLGCGACAAALAGGCAARLGTDATSVTAQSGSSTRCPKGLVNDPYPGSCHHYVDSNGSGYCDLSETA
jgi:hypothetical protein